MKSEISLVIGATSKHNQHTTHKQRILCAEMPD